LILIPVVIWSAIPDRLVVMVDLDMMLPLTMRWVQKQQKVIRQDGQTIGGDVLRLAKQVGVRCPERIRVLLVDTIPVPTGPMLREMAEESGVVSSSTVGLALGYSVYIRKKGMNPRIFAHEFRHVHQFEKDGSLELFLDKYLKQVTAFGYQRAPLEIDARKYEVESF